MELAGEKVCICIYACMYVSVYVCIWAHGPLSTVEMWDGSSWREGVYMYVCMYVCMYIQQKGVYV
jgi:hypothetical protein